LQNLDRVDVTLRPLRFSDTNKADFTPGRRCVDHAPIADIEANVDIGTAAAEMIKQQVARLDIVEFDPLTSLQLISGAARHDEPGFGIGVLNKTAAVESGGLIATESIWTSKL